ncbi:MAG: hypothetical protein JNL70_17105 [Saprospiraceae bacterium]|nr:hypothetical protein [Saprospiraceae bacterium]
MGNFLNKSGIALVACLIELAMVKYGEFAFGGIFVIFMLVGGMMILMGHKNAGWGILSGTILFILVLLLFGWTFMEGWPGPQEFMNGKRYEKK